MCSEIDIQISYALCSIQVDPELIPSIRVAYTQDLAAKLGYLKPDQKEELRASLKLIDEEEARMVRLLASGRISEGVWDGLWREWQDRRSQIHKTLDLLEKDRAFHIDNLDAALQVIAQIGTLYNGLQRSEQKQLLRQVIDRVVVNEEGIARLELRAPFAYLNNLSNEIIKVGKHARGKQKTGREIIPTSSVELCSTQLQLCWGTHTNITSSRNQNDEFIAWDPQYVGSGYRFAFVSDQGGVENTNDVLIMNGELGQNQQIVQTITKPNWSTANFGENNPDW